ncbi:MAG: HU family DNA-binding protein [Alphaproteobacteria bacterium]|nr:HU family DNA-binding protein [Alphaproteobacteria bacterium]
MNKNEFIAAICDNKALQKMDLSKSCVAQVVEACFNTIETSLKRGEEVRLVGFGNFYVSKRNASKGRNPRTGESIQIKASRQPKFRAGKQLKEQVNSNSSSGGSGRR